MGNEVSKFKIEYNYWLKRRLKAEKYFEQNSPAKCLLYLEEFNRVTEKLSLLPEKYLELTGVEMTYSEVMQGFKGV